MLLVAIAAEAIYQGPLQIVEDGQVLDLHVVAMSQAGETALFRTEGRKLTVRWGGEIRGFIGKKAMDEMPPDNIYKFSLLNKELSYDIDLSAVDCSCNAALFFVTMPGYSQNGTVAPGTFNPYYCDANRMGGVWCWEHDSAESNKYAFATTPHRCDASPGGYISKCDAAGPGKKTDPTVLCPSAECAIDTRKPFHISQQYPAEDGKVVRILNIFTQGENRHELEACADAAYLDSMSMPLTDMAMVFQVWGTSYSVMDWLDKDTGCTGDCDASVTSGTFANIEINSLPEAMEVVV